MQDKLTLDKLESWLWESANILRGRIDSGDYKNYIFGMLFLKRISDVFEEECNRIKEEHGEALMYDEDFHKFLVPDKARWDNIKNTTKDIGAAINKAFEELEQENPKLLEGVLTPIDFNNKERLPDSTLEKLIQHFSKYSLKNKDLEDPDILGRAYEYLINKFADDAGKKGGEFYTPQNVVKLLVEVLDPKPKMRIHDPCCGSGGMLVYSAEHLIEKNQNPSNLTLTGQEINLNTWAICKMNMLLHRLYDAKIVKGDTMENPKFTEGGELKKYDIVIANPMWNQKNWNKADFKEMAYDRFHYGYPPGNSADWAWIQHMLASTNRDGKVGVVLDNGVLFRSRSEGKIRKKVLQNDLIEAVIALPPNLFYNTSSPGCILILNKNKPEDRKNKVIFIYGEEDYEELSNQNKLRKQDIEKIVNTYNNFEDNEKYSRVVDMEEIERNDFNLNVPRYVDTTEPEEEIDVQEVIDELNEIEEKREDVEREMKGFLEELGFDLDNK
ncbi:MAG: type I restriction-modification system subunit M [Candidatus Mcinerneyibacterium aminivorans]|uniref:site-specific DNA-methyltransferase (adenine-specific) n=1 Tax=Candidatus Mcinerneyibacterium aminivorans TaxID=2703815 RepID=A0A5D0MAM6_9BACT|nr:MAG: type I restriction-modification system subunit M [Candidatus Mcinerneyibacterium aminivorans]